MRRELGVEIETLICGAVEKSSLFLPKRYRTKGPTLYKGEAEGRRIQLYVLECACGLRITPLPGASSRIYRGGFPTAYRAGTS
eukprot:4013294-Prymnesium_polylepis.1